MSARAKVLSRERAAEAVRRAQRCGEQVVFTNGCFDILHVGHVRSLEQARSLGDVLVVAVNSDASVRRLKGPSRPVVPARQRMEVLAALSCVDWVIPFPEATPLAAIKALRPDVLAKGGDWALDEIVGRREVESWGGRVERLKEIRGIRTSAIVEQVARESLSTSESKPAAQASNSQRPRRGESAVGSGKPRTKTPARKRPSSK